MAEGERTRIKFPRDDARNQKTGNDKEYIDADKSATHHSDIEVEKYDGENGNRAKPVYIWSVGLAAHARIMWFIGKQGGRPDMKPGKISVRLLPFGPDRISDISAPKPTFRGRI